MNYSACLTGRRAVPGRSVDFSQRPTIRYGCCIKLQQRPWSYGLRFTSALRQPTRTSATLTRSFDVEFNRVEILTEKAAEAQREADKAMAKLQPYEEWSSYLGRCV